MLTGYSNFDLNFGIWGLKFNPQKRAHKKKHELKSTSL